MGLSTSLFAGISGLQGNQTRLDVIGNNLANVNTYGFKSQRVLFQDLLYNTMKSGTAPDDQNGGTNPSQVGSGVGVSQVSTDFSQGDFETTGIDSDLAIEGNGFFVLRSGSSNVYTRDGAFTLNQERKLVNPTSGSLVQGWNQSRDNTGESTVNAGGALRDVVIPVGDNRIAKATSEVILNGNLNGAGDTSSSGSILNSQRLYSTSTSDTTDLTLGEITSGSIDLKGVYVKDPAGGVDNVRLFAGSGSDGSDNNVLASGDQIIVQMNKGGRPLEAIFVYGQGDLVSNATGSLGADGNPDAGLESYDGTTLNDFTRWFDEAFGLVALENKGASPDSNAAHGIDGDNPNDLVDMGNGGANPFVDETDGSGFDLVLTSKGATGLTGNTPVASVSVPKAGIEGSTRTFSVLAGSISDVGTGNSFVDMDGDSKFNSDKDITLNGVTSYVVTGNSTVSKGVQSNGASSENLVLKAFDITTDNSDVYIDFGGNGIYDKGIDLVIKNAFSQDIFNIAGAGSGAAQGIGTLGTVSTSDTRMTLTHVGTDLNISKGMFFIQGATTTYTVADVNEVSGNTLVTFTVANDGAGAGVVVGSVVDEVTYQGASLVAAGYTKTSSTTVGSTIVTNMNVPVAVTHPITGSFVGQKIYTTQADNEKGVAGSKFIEGDVPLRVAVAPVTLAINGVGVDGSGNRTLTFLAAVSSDLRTGMLLNVAGTTYTIDEISANGLTVTLDKADATGTDFAAASSVTFSGIVFEDADNDGSLSEVVYRVRNDIGVGSSGDLFIDLDHNGLKATTDLVVSNSTTVLGLASFSDNEVVYTDVLTGNIYRKVPLKFDVTQRTVYLDKLNKGTYDEVSYSLINSGTTASPRWVVDENRDGAADDGETTVVSIKANTDTDFATETAIFNRPSSTYVNGVQTGSSRLQIRGNIGSVNGLSKIAFISGVDNVERNIFANSTLTNGNDNAASEQVVANGESISQNIVVYDSLGKSHDVNLTFVLEQKDNDKAEWRWFAEAPDASRQGGFFPVNDPRGANPAINVGTGRAIFDNFGRFLRTEPSTALISMPIEGQNTDSSLEIELDFSILTQFANAAGSEIDVREQDGYAQGVMDRFTVDGKGQVIGIYTNGLREVVAQVALAAFANPSGLVREGANMFTVSANSGSAMVGEALTGERGFIRSKSLELSNVDITTEFTKMITTQRAYQANSRVITKSDELLQELIQLIR